MAQLFGLSGEQVDGIRPLFPKERGVKRVDDRKVLSSIIPVIQKGLRWVDAPAAYGPHKTFYNRCLRWRDKGVFELIFSELSASDSAEPEVLMIIARRAASKGGAPAWLVAPRGT